MLDGKLNPTPTHENRSPRKGEEVTNGSHVQILGTPPSRRGNADQMSALTNSSTNPNFCSDSKYVRSFDGSKYSTLPVMRAYVVNGA